MNNGTTRKTAGGRALALTAVVLGGCVSPSVDSVRTRPAPGPGAAAPSDPSLIRASVGNAADSQPVVVEDSPLQVAQRPATTATAAPAAPTAPAATLPEAPTAPTVASTAAAADPDDDLRDLLKRSYKRHVNTIGDQGVIRFGPLAQSPSMVTLVHYFSLNVTDNNSAGLQDRIIPLEYYHFFDSHRVYPGVPYAPVRAAVSGFNSRYQQTRVSTDDDRYVFGFEKVLADRLSVIVRQSVVTINTPDLTLQRGFELHKLGGTGGGFSDLQVVPKYLLFQDETRTVTTGVGMVIPVGAHNGYRQFGNSAFVFQPNLLWLAQPTERIVTQGGLEYDVPVANDLGGASLFRWLMFGGYRVYSNPGSRGVESVYPLIEFHGSHLLGHYTQTTVNVTAGVRVNAFGRFQFGMGYVFPVTDQRQFSDEILANVNVFF